MEPATLTSLASHSPGDTMIEDDTEFTNGLRLAALAAEASKTLDAHTTRIGAQRTFPPTSIRNLAAPVTWGVGLSYREGASGPPVGICKGLACWCVIGHTCRDGRITGGFHDAQSFEFNLGRGCAGDIAGAHGGGICIG